MNSMALVNNCIFTKYLDHKMVSTNTMGIRVTLVYHMRLKNDPLSIATAAGYEGIPL